MKHFVVSISFNVPVEAIGEHLVQQHYAFLDEGCWRGYVLLYGPHRPAEGTLLIARIESRERLLEGLESDPLWRLGLMSFEVREFIPVRYPATLQGWVDPLGFHSTEG